MRDDVLWVEYTNPPTFSASFSVFLPAWILKEINYVFQLHAALKHIWSQQKEMPQGGVILHLGDEH